MLAPLKSVKIAKARLNHAEKKKKLAAFSRQFL
jgi:hypothetical protein